MEPTPPNHLVRFERWFVTPVKMLKQVDNGDASFVILSIGLMLCERYYRSKTAIIDEHWKRDFLKEAAKDLDVDEGFFETFWDLFRNGTQHQASPKSDSTYEWRISRAYAAVPTLCEINGQKIICLDPEKFTDSMIQKWLSNPGMLEEGSLHQFGEISETQGCNCQPQPPAPLALQGGQTVNQHMIQQTVTPPAYSYGTGSPITGKKDP